MRRLFLAIGLLLALALPAAAGSPQKELLLNGGCPSWSILCAPVDLWFAQGLYRPSSALSNITTTRASVGYQQDASGNWYSFASGVPRITNLGIGVWESRTNGIRDSTMQGAVTGSPGTLPNNWGVSPLPTGLTRTIAIGTTNGVQWITLNYSGTTTSSSAIQVNFEGTSIIAASYGQTWVHSAIIQVTQDDPSLSGLNLGFSEENSGGSQVAFGTGSSFYSTRLSFTRYAANRTLTNSATAYVRPYLSTNVIASSTTINLTILFAVSQLENNSNINSTVASATVATGGTCTPGTYTFTVSGGTGTAATISGTVSGTTLSGTLTVVTAGSYSVFPPSPASTSGGTCTVQPTLTLAPTNLAADAFASPPCPTTSAAATCLADANAMPVSGGTCSTSACSVLATWTPSAPTGYPVTQVAAEIDDGTTANNLLVQRVASNGDPQVSTTISSTATTATPSGTWAQSAAQKLVALAVSGLLSGRYAGGTVATASPTGIASGLNTLRIGTNEAGTGQCDCVISRLVVAPQSLLAN